MKLSIRKAPTIDIIEPTRYFLPDSGWVYAPLDSRNVKGVLGRALTKSHEKRKEMLKEILEK